MRLVPRLARRPLLAISALIFGPPPALPDDDLSTAVRRTVVRGAQLADAADGVWQQFAGEVTPPWQKQQKVSPQSVPPPYLDGSFAQELLTLPLAAGAECAGVSVDSLLAKLPAARQNAVLLYSGGSGGSEEPEAGTARRFFSKALATAVESDGTAISSATVFNFEAFVRWRVLQSVLSDLQEPADRARIQQCFRRRLGSALLRGPLRGALPSEGSRSGRAVPLLLREVLDNCNALLQRMQSQGLFSRVALQRLDTSTDLLLDEPGWRTDTVKPSWSYVISGCAIVGASQLAQDRTAATGGAGAGLFPGQLITTALEAYLSEEAGVGAARCEEYFVDNRVGKPDPRTFSDSSYYSDVLLVVDVL